MGDRTTVFIRLSGKLAADKVSDLISAIEAECGKVNDDEDAPLASNLQNTFRFEECNYAKIDSVTDFAKANGLSYNLSHESGGCYGPGILIYDAETGKEREASTSLDGEVIIAASQFDRFVSEYGNGANLVTAISAYFDSFNDTLPPLVIGGVK